MSVRIYLLPWIGTGEPGVDPRRAKYLVGIDTLPLMGSDIHCMPYGRQGVCLVSANVTTAEHNSLVAHDDVAAVPANLDATIGGALATVVAALEPMHFPCEWVTAQTTWRTLVRAVARLIALAQRVDGVTNGGRLLPVGITLDSTIGDLSAAQRDFMKTAIESFGGTFAGITLSMTIRTGLEYLAAQSPLAGNLGTVSL